MEKLLSMETLIAVVMMGYGLWTLYRSGAQLVTNVKLRNEYKKTHKDYEEVNVYTGFLIFFALMLIAGVYLAFFPYVEENEFYFRLAYVMIAMIAVSMGMDTLVKRRILFDTNGFLYEKAFYRYRSVTNVRKDKGALHNMEIATLEESRITISRKMGEAFLRNYEAWKVRKKKKK